jgi:heat shock protein 5
MPLPSVGNDAMNSFHFNPKNTIFDAKWLIDCCMDDYNVKKDMKHWPFKVIEKNNKPSIAIKHKGLDHDFVSFGQTIQATFSLSDRRLKK